MANNPPNSGPQPPAIGSMGSQNFGSSYPVQFRPVPGQTGQQFMQASSAGQQFGPVGQGIPAGQNQMPQFSQPMQQLPSRPVLLTPSSQAMSMPYMQPNMGFASGSAQFQNAVPPNNYPGQGGPGVSLSSAYTFATSYGQPQNTMNVPSQFQPVSQMHAPVVSHGGQPWLPPGSQGAPIVNPVHQTGLQPLANATSAQAMNVLTSEETSSDWQEFRAEGERRYYYNKRTKQSCWEKPLELMSPMERADASTVWKEFTTPEGKKYYYNKDTKESKWSIPEELKLAREQAQKEATQGTQSGMVTTPKASDTVTVSSTEQPSPAASLVAQPSTSIVAGVASSPVAVTPTVSHGEMVTLSPATTPGSASALILQTNNISSPKTSMENPISDAVAISIDGASLQDIEEAKKGMAVAGKVNVTPLEEKAVDDEPLIYANKQEAKNAFKSLLESANVEADWNWEQAMRVIINDKRYGALKTLGERKQAFNEYLMQRKKLEAEERRLRQRKAKEEFTKMLEESKELTSSMRWSKAIALFEEDERFKAVERAADREDLFQNYLVDLQKKERIKAQEEQRQNRLEYRQFLESCGLIKVDTQWRKVQDRLEDDERCSRLEKIDRLEIFQEYIRDLEKEEDEQRKLRKEQMKRLERKNRDEFRKMLEEHVADGTLTAKTYWRDYCQKVKDTAPYQAVASNITGSTPKDLFEDVVEELERQYHEDKTRLKEAMKLMKVTVASTWTFGDFKAAIEEGVEKSLISDVNLQLVFEDLLERAKEKEEKEAKKRLRLVKDFTEKLGTYKEINASSTWEECKELFEESSEYRSIGEEIICREIFEEYVARLLEKAKEKERKRDEEKAKKEKEREEKEKRKEKERREKEKEKEREEEEKEKEREKEKEKGKERARKEEIDSEMADATDSYGHKEEKKRDKDKERKHRKRHQSTADELDSEKDEREDSKKSRRHGSDRKKSRKHSPESDTESRHKRHKRDHRDSSRRNGGGYEELEDGELGEDGEIR